MSVLLPTIKSMYRNSFFPLHFTDECYASNTVNVWCACNTFLKVFLYCKVWDGGVGSTWMCVWWKHDYACTAFFELSKFSYYLMLFPSFQPCTITATRVCMCMTLCSLPTNKTIEHVVFLGAPSFFLSRFQEHKRQLLGLKSD